MFSMIQQWFNKHLSDPEAVALLVVIVICIMGLMFIGGILAPVLTSVVIAYLLNGFVKFLDQCKLPHTVSTSIVCIIFLSLLYLSLFILLPILWDQLSTLIIEFPRLFAKSNNLINQLHEKYPDYISVDQIKHLLLSFKSELAQLGQYAISFSITSISNVSTVVIYLVLVPLMVFFMLKDGDIIVPWLAQFIPQRRKLINQVWEDVQEKIGKYIRAKALEIILVGGVSIAAFIWLGLNYSVLLGVLVGLSVLIPFVGVTVVTFPVVIVAYLQWGWSADFAYAIIVYTIIAVLDGNVLAPLLFSEAVKLHPVAVIVAILFFGGIWGIWGVFFAIPLATMVKAILDAWPARQLEQSEQQS